MQRGKKRVGIPPLTKQCPVCNKAIEIWDLRQSSKQYHEKCYTIRKKIYNTWYRRSRHWIKFSELLKLLGFPPRKNKNRWNGYQFAPITRNCFDTLLP